MTEAQEARPGVRVRDVGWGALAALCLVSGTSVVFALVWNIVKGDVAQVLAIGVSLLLHWWIGMGAWRRTRWGRPRDVEVAAPPPRL